MQMEGYNKKIGEFGENIAAQYLERQGAKITGKNYYTRYGEIDLIARLGDEILFVEVKTRTSNDYGYPEEAVDWRKLIHLNKAINIYLDKECLNDIFWRIDVISVEINAKTKTAKIRWFKNLGQ
ncbi:MAG: YraN family protein [Candidatus Buchananbacteria bacterium]